MEPLTLLVLSVLVFAVPLAVAFVLHRFRQRFPEPARRQLKQNTWLLAWLLLLVWPLHLISLWPSVEYREWPPGNRLLAAASLLVMTTSLIW